MSPSEGLLTFDEAVERILAGATPVGGSESVDLWAGLGRVLAEKLTAKTNVPVADNSAMDGYAFRISDVPASGARLPISQRIFAGDVCERLAPGTAARIFTGAPVPPGADTVIAQERVSVEDQTVHIAEPIPRGKNVRMVGESAREGDVVLTPGRRIGPQALAIAASVGHARLRVHRRPRVATFSTGSELRDPGSSLEPGQIFDSNRVMLRALIEGLGCEAVDLGVVPDDLGRTLAILREAAGTADAIVTTGGVSVGEADYVHEAAKELGRLDFWRVAIKPGKPVAFGRIGQAGFFGLPGNPVSAFVTFCLFTRPYLLRLAGRGDVDPDPVEIPAGFTRQVSANRREFLRARATIGSDGRRRLELFDHQGSHVLGSLEWATGLVDLPPGASIREGDTVAFLPFARLLR